MHVVLQLFVAVGVRVRARTHTRPYTYVKFVPDITIDFL